MTTKQRISHPHLGLNISSVKVIGFVDFAFAENSLTIQQKLYLKQAKEKFETTKKQMDFARNEEHFRNKWISAFNFRITFTVYTPALILLPKHAKTRERRRLTSFLEFDSADGR